MPFINTSEATKWSSDQTENGKCINVTNRRIRVFCKILLSALTGKISGRRWNRRDLPRPSQLVERQQRLCLSVNIQKITWSGLTEQNDVMFHRLKAYPNQRAQTVSPPSWIWHFWLCKLANLLHPGFQGAKRARDQPIPGPFPAPPPSQGKGPGNEVAQRLKWSAIVLETPGTWSARISKSKTADKNHISRRQRCTPECENDQSSRQTLFSLSQEMITRWQRRAVPQSLNSP